jgi:hypothetical protein
MLFKDDTSDYTVLNEIGIWHWWKKDPHRPRGTKALYVNSSLILAGIFGLISVFWQKAVFSILMRSGSNFAKNDCGPRIKESRWWRRKPSSTPLANSQQPWYERVENKLDSYCQASINTILLHFDTFPVYVTVSQDPSFLPRLPNDRFPTTFGIIFFMHFSSPVS